MAFGYYRLFTVDHTKVNTGTQTNFPVVISGTYSWAAGTGSGGRSLNASGFDIRPYSNSGLSSAYTYQLRSYNATTGDFNMVVLIPSLSAAVDTLIYMGIGDAALTADGSSTSVWDANFKAVYALGDGTTLSLADSTSNGNTLTNNNTVTATAGLVGGMGAASFNGSTQSLSKNAAVLATDPMTLEVMYNPSENTTSGDMVSIGANANATSLRSLIKRASNVLRATMFGTGTTGNADTGATAYTASAWNYAAGTYTSAASRDAHPNGATKTNNATNVTSMTNADRFCLAARMHNGTTGNFFAGKLGEARVSSVVRADDWIKTTYNNLIGIASFYSVGAEVPVSGGVKPAPAALFQFTHR